MPRAVIDADMRTGKTRIVLEEAKREGRPILVIAPKTGLLVWKEQAKLWGYQGDMFLMNYEQVWRNPGRKFGLNVKLEEVAGRMAHEGILVFDECHRISSRRTKQTRACWKLSDIWRGKVRLLTGTLVRNGLVDLYAQYRALGRGLVFDSWTSFADRYVVFHPVYRWKPVGYLRVDELADRIKPFTVSVRAKDCLDLPEQMTVWRSCQMPPAAEKVYRDLERRLRAEVSEETVTAPTTVAKVLRLCELAGGFVHTDSGTVRKVHGAKLELLQDVLDEVPPGEQVVVYCRFLAELDAIAGLLGGDCRTVHGQVSGQEREEVLESFRNKEFRYLVATVQVAGLGIDLSTARYTVYYSIGFSFADYYQSSWRTVHPEKHDPVYLVHLKTEGTVDSYVWKAVRRKQSVRDALRDWLVGKEEEEEHL